MLLMFLCHSPFLICVYFHGFEFAGFEVFGLITVGISMILRCLMFVLLKTKCRLKRKLLSVS